MYHMTVKYVGAHVSSAGGVENAPLNAHSIGARAFAFFTKNQRQWKSKPLTEESIRLFKEHCKTLQFGKNQILPHDSYLINLGHPEKEALQRSREAFLDELHRCQLLGMDRLNFHPGSHLRQVSEETCLAVIAESINWALERIKKVCVVLENTAGQGSNVGYRFEHLAEIIEQVEDKRRVGVCFDTCHAFAAGYDLRTPEQCEAVFEAMESIIGFSYLKGMYLNDSKSGLGSRVDRHQSLGYGELGWSVFRCIMQDVRFNPIPLVLETINSELWPNEIRQWYALSFGASVHLSAQN